MSYYKTCQYCPMRTTCEKKREIQAAIKGLNITSVSFKCKSRFKDFPLGCRVRYCFSVAENGRSEEVDLDGTVFQHHKSGKLLVWLDESATEGRFIVKLRPDLVIKLDEPLIKLCSECGRPDGEKNRDDWDCPMCNRGITRKQEQDDCRISI